MLWIRDEADLDDPLVVENKVDDHARVAARRKHEARFAVHRSEQRRPQAVSEDVGDGVSAVDLRGESGYTRAQTCFHSRCVRTQDNVGIKDCEEGGKVATL